VNLYATTNNTTTKDTSNDQIRLVIQKVRQALDLIKPFKVTFIQQVFSDSQGDQAPDVEESGEILFNHSQQLKWTYLKPDLKVFLLEGDQYRFYDQDNEQLIIGTVKEKSRQWIWQLLFSEELFNFSELHWDAKKKSLHIRDNDDLEMEIFLTDRFLPEKIVQTEGIGTRILYFFKDYQEHISFQVDAFQLNIPEDTEIIREEDQSAGENREKKSKNEI